MKRKHILSTSLFALLLSAQFATASEFFGEPSDDGDDGDNGGRAALVASSAVVGGGADDAAIDLAASSAGVGAVAVEDDAASENEGDAAGAVDLAASSAGAGAGAGEEKVLFYDPRDYDHDGEVSWREKLRAKLDRNLDGKITGTDFLMLFGFKDLDGDGLISKNEFMIVLHQALDVNDDGKITLADAQAFVEKVVTAGRTVVSVVEEATGVLERLQGNPFFAQLPEGARTQFTTLLETITGLNEQLSGGVDAVDDYLGEVMDKLEGLIKEFKKMKVPLTEAQWHFIEQEILDGLMMVRAGAGAAGVGEGDVLEMSEEKLAALDPKLTKLLRRLEKVEATVVAGDDEGAGASSTATDE